MQMVSRIGAKFPSHEISISQIQTDLISLSIVSRSQFDLATFSSEVENIVADLPIKDATVRAATLDRIISRLIESKGCHGEEDDEKVRKSIFVRKSK